jgi:hypothetical protein
MKHCPFTDKTILAAAKAHSVSAAQVPIGFGRFVASQIEVLNRGPK